MFEQPNSEESLASSAHCGTGAQEPKGSRPLARPDPGVLVVVEGLHDIEFLRRISRILYLHDVAVPDLNCLEQSDRLIFIPVGGGNLQHWTNRTRALGWREFHLYDREAPPETTLRVQAARLVNSRPNCHAAVMRKRSIENYLSPSAIEEAKGIRISFSDLDSVADLAARACLPANCRFSNLSRRAQNRLRYRAKKWLNRDAVKRMTPTRLAEQDPFGELAGWLGMIGRLAQ